MSLTSAIYNSILQNPSDYVAYYDFLDSISMEFHTELTAEERENLALNKQVQGLIARELANGGNVDELFNIYSRSLLTAAPYDFEQFMLYVEIDRPPEEKFYAPRRKRLHQAVVAMQELADGELDELFLSQPPRTGKTGLMSFFSLFMMGRYPNKSGLYSSYSSPITTAFYNGLIEIIKDPYTYHYEKVFPQAPLKKTNANETTINLQRNSKYPSITARSIDGTLNGACDASNFMIGDDFCSGYEQAINKDRMAKLWNVVNNNWMSRRKQKCVILWNGTRWSLIDPIGIRIEMLENDENFRDVRWKVINIPALDENDESNFDYDYGVGFNTAYYKQLRAGYERREDVASWLAQYQGEPVEREGALFASGEIKFYNGELPEKEPDRRFMAVDPAFGGGDYTAAPVCLMWDDDIYVPDVVYSNADKTVTMPLLADTIARYKIELVQFEANKMLQSYVDEFQNLLKERGIRCTIITKPPQNNKSKHQRIMDKASDIREHMIFLDSGQRKTHYQRFLDNVYSFKIYNEKQHDDAPDSLAMAIGMVFRFDDHYAHVFKRFI